VTDQLWIHICRIAIKSMPMLDFITLLHRASAYGGRSTVLKPLAWLIGICSVASIAAFHYEAPAWLGTMFGIFVALSVILYLAAYVYFALTDKDSLRSETFYIQKLAIQKGFVGDDITGYIRLEDQTRTPSLPAAIDQKKPEDA
jgi:hypothetical protein